MQLNRERFRKIIGVVDKRVSYSDPALEATSTRPALVGETAAYTMHTVRWPVLEGVDAEGLLLDPKRPAGASVVALPDADWTLEMLAGIVEGVPPSSQFARRLAENGCRVLVPVLIDRQDAFSGDDNVG